MRIITNIIYRYFIAAVIICLYQSCIYSQGKTKLIHQESTQRFNEVALHWKNKNYDQLRMWVSNNIRKKADLKRLYKIAVSIKANDLKNAINATINIEDKCKNIKISKGEILQLALFIETDLKNKVRNKQYYFDSEKTNLPRSIEVDPKNGNIIVYLEKGLSTVGKGHVKYFNRSLLYNVNSPEIVTTGFFNIPKASSSLRDRLLREVEVMKKLQGNMGIVKFHSIFTHNNIDENNDEIVFVEKFYSEGAIRNFLKKHRYSLKKSEKIKIAADLINGLSSMHKMGMTHSDLHPGNYLIDVSKKKKKRQVSGVITDFARVSYFGKQSLGAKDVNDPSYYLVRRDIHQLGHVLYGLYHDFNPPRLLRSLKPVKSNKLNSGKNGTQFEALIHRMLDAQKNMINSDELVEEINKIR